MQNRYLINALFFTVLFLNSFYVNGTEPKDGDLYLIPAEYNAQTQSWIVYSSTKSLGDNGAYIFRPKANDLSQKIKNDDNNPIATNYPKFEKGHAFKMTNTGYKKLILYTPGNEIFEKVIISIVLLAGTGTVCAMALKSFRII